MSAGSNGIWKGLGLPEPSGHPVHGVLSGEELLGLARRGEEGVAALVEWYGKREELIRLESVDPLRYGVEFEPWKEARGLLREAGSDVLILGGNRASKTEFASKLVVEALLAGPRRNVWCFQSDEMASIERQQPYVRRYLPPELRAAGKVGSVTNVKWTDKNGFSDGVFILPNGSRCRFMSYSMDPASLEGAELDLCWCDELVPPDFLETLRFRLVTRGGRMIVTFTPIEGYSVTVKQYLEGASVVKALPADLLPQDRVHVQGCGRGEIPYVLRCPTPRRSVICFHSRFNLFNPVENLERLLAGRPEEEVRCRAYGWPSKQVAGAFPKFGDWNVVGPEAVPSASEGTSYLVVDPGGAKNWFMVWIRVDALGRVFVYREWPDVGSVGEWALASEKADGKAGPGQRVDAGRGILGYKRLILEKEGVGGREKSEVRSQKDGTNGSNGAYDVRFKTIETLIELGGGGDLMKEENYKRKWRMAEGNGEVIFERLIDPRAGAAQVPGIEDGTSIIDMMAEEQVDRDGNVVGPSMLFVPSPACRVDEGVNLINEWLDWDMEKALCAATNAPRLYVSRECENVIFALRTWTGLDGEKGATKDPVDCLKYAAKRGLEWMGGERLRMRPGRGF